MADIGFANVEVLSAANTKVLAINNTRVSLKKGYGLMTPIATFEVAVSDILNALDVQPVKHGRWYHNTSKYISELDAYFIQACCSCFGKYSDRVDAYSQIMSNENCSHCGARMDGDKE